ncbi:MAG TPA: DUF5667 domain-containing protein [Jatrophihabitans sp.]|jgi:hypothetical protein|uniref:DUF5667 domain-containing protein n=1 Tax=Jatrophihabitans sp. TaxID=1932789 RepID=UPI002E0CE0D1|nr:DUF5667 domain-containing protein [Jatrophihabitans sp.]
MSEHRVSMPTLRRFEDPENSRDPRVQAVLTQLKSVQIAPAPRAHFRAELRAQLVAVAPRIIAEGAAEQQKSSGRVASTVKAGAAERRRGFSLARPLAVAATVACAFLVLLGGAVWMSQKSLPGDALYGLKRASENVRLSMATTDAGKAKQYLDLAATRVAEANDLVTHTSALGAGSGTLAGGGMSASTARLITGNLTSANSDVASASSLLGTDAVRNHSAAPLTTLTTWAPGQQQRLQALAGAVSDPAVRQQALNSAGFVRAASLRAQTLESRIGSTCLATAPKDSLGPKPCIDRTVVRPTPTKGRTAAKPAPRVTVPNGRHSTATVPGPIGATGGSTSGTPLLPIATPTTPALPLPLPTLPLKLPLPTSTGGPLSATSCSVTVLGIRIGCPSSSAP